MPEKENSKLIYENKPNVRRFQGKRMGGNMEGKTLIILTGTGQGLNP
jgi:hypothetical protein